MNYKPPKPSAIENALQEIKGEDKEDDYVTNSMGAFGSWQLIFILIGSSTRSIAAWNIISIAFIAPETNFVCKKFSDNTTANITLNACYEKCIEYEYTNELFEDSMISEFGMICEKKWLQSFTQPTMMSGLLCGVTIIGWFSDRFGRSKAMILSGIACAIFMLATAFCPNIWSIAAARFVSGIGTGGYLTLTSVYLSELVGTRMIDIVVCSFLLPFDGIGLCVQAAFAYYTSTWRTFMIVCGSVTAFMVCLTLFLPETPRWHIAKGQRTEAIELMTRAAKFNKLDTSKIRENVEKVTEQLSLKEKKNVNLTYLHLFETKKIAVWTVASVSIWFITGFSYFGLLQHVSSFGSNFYTVAIILGLVQIIAAPVSLTIVKFCSRKLSAICIYLIIGLLSVALVFTSKGSATAVVLGSLGVAAASTSFALVYIIVIELYPTPMRNMGLSMSSIGSKVAAIVAPFIVNLRSHWIASSIFAAVGFSAVIFCFILPETKGKKLRDSIADVE